jgi:hypothetical protein
MTIEPNRTESRPRLSPRTPQISPPRSMPPICMFSSSTPRLRISSSGTPIPRRLSTRTMLKRMIVDVDEIAQRRHEDGEHHAARGPDGRRGRDGHGRPFYCRVSADADVAPETVLATVAHVGPDRQQSRRMSERMLSSLPISRGACPIDPPGNVRDRRAARLRRHGRGLSRPRREAAPRGRD